MLLLIIFGIGMCVFGVLMVAKPMAFSNGIAAFSEKPWFHIFEIVSRLLLGLAFLVFSSSTTYPKTCLFIGTLLCCVSVFLIAIGPNRHKQFALRTARIGKWFRPLGLVAIIGGMGLIILGSS